MYEVDVCTDATPDLLLTPFSILAILTYMWWQTAVAVVCFPYGLTCRTTSHVPLCHPNTFFSEMSIDVSCPLSKWTVFTLFVPR